MSKNNYCIPSNTNISDEFLTSIFEENENLFFPEVPKHNPYILPKVPTHKALNVKKKVNKTNDEDISINILSKYLKINEIHIKLNTKEYKSKLFDKRLSLLVTKNKNELELLNNYVKNIKYVDKLI